MRVAPAAIPYLRRFAVYPKHVQATGPRKHLTKGDVLEYVKKMNLQAVELKRPLSDYIDMNEFKTAAKQAEAKPIETKPAETKK